LAKLKLGEHACGIGRLACKFAAEATQVPPHSRV
jgi:hypothetical protein